MKTSTLCKALLKDACDETLSFYRSMLTTQDLSAVKDEEWRAIIGLARELKPHQQEILLSFARIASIDAISTLCGAIDGTTQVGGQFVAFSLTDESGTEHAGSMQDSFLSAAYP
ncbi:hypothetical protein [Aquipseudomonas alcaligenes]|uniref:hypothetical protein n=1 Tax=Aquipseudomonas alcaligenes TaxID=43263 RepID=UPI00117A9728|nr:hypothetical protein [Pseudomonas alcaligenes]